MDLDLNYVYCWVLFHVGTKFLCFFSLKSFTVVGWKMNNEMNIWVDDEVLDEELG